MNTFDWIVCGVVGVVALGFGVLWLLAKSMSDRP